MNSVPEGRRHDGTGKAWGRNSLLAAGILAASFPINDANAAKVCPGVSAETFMGATQITDTCGANTGAITAGALSSDSQNKIEERRKQQIEARRQAEERRKKQNRTVSGRALGFAPDSTDYSDSGDSTFGPGLGALGYSKSPVFTKAEPLEPTIETVVWGRGFFVHDNQTGTSNVTDFAAVSRSVGALAGIDQTLALPSEQHVTFGAFGGEAITTHTMSLGDRSTTRAPTAGAYLLYFAGDAFSADVTYGHSWFQNSGPDRAVAFLGGNATYVQTALETARAVDLVDANLHYRFNPGARDGSWWWEPTFGVLQAFITQSLGLQNQTMTRVKGGVNVGTSFDWGGAAVEPRFAALAFSDVSVNGVEADILTDRSQLWGKVIATLNFVWSKSFSTAIEGQVYGTSGVLNIIGYAGMLQARYRW
jgi:outer membrane autotransporter protein